MPFFGSPYRFGHLYIDFEIIFPAKLDEQETQKISEILNNYKINKDKMDGKEESYFISDYKAEDENTNYKGGNEKEREEDGEDDDEASRHGHRTMNCAHQ